MPQSNSPLTNVGAKEFTCNVGGTKGVAGKCPVKAGGSVTVEMHQVRIHKPQAQGQTNSAPSNPVTGSVAARPSAVLIGAPSRAT